MRHQHLKRRGESRSSVCLLRRKKTVHLALSEFQCCCNCHHCGLPKRKNPSHKHLYLDPLSPPLLSLCGFFSFDVFFLFLLLPTILCLCFPQTQTLFTQILSLSFQVRFAAGRSLFLVFFSSFFSSFLSFPFFLFLFLLPPSLFAAFFPLLSLLLFFVFFLLAYCTLPHVNHAEACGQGQAIHRACITFDIPPQKV